MQEDTPERETRSGGNFQSAEASLPRRIGSRFNIPLVDNASSFLGGLNPMSREVNPETESVWLLDNTAYRPVHVYPHTPQPFQAEFSAAYFRKNTGKDVSKIVADIADNIGLKAESGNEKGGKRRIAERLQPFIDTIAPARSVIIELPNGRKEKLGPGGRSAVSEQTIVALGEHKDGEGIGVNTVPPGIAPHGAMTTHFAETHGWLIISDIDDSIKVTMTPSPIGILRTTFVDDPKVITGMPELYSQIASTLNPTWFYLSASPYNLYPFLRKFLHEHYPKGPIILRDASWMDLGGFLASLTQGTQVYKRTRMEKIYNHFPQRKVICVGDSTQSDPEAYGDICRKYKGWVKAVFIRKVVDVPEMNKGDKNTDQRFEKAFKNVDKGIWKTFVDPKELTDAVAKLKEIS